MINHGLVFPPHSKVDPGNKRCVLHIISSLSYGVQRRLDMLVVRALIGTKIDLDVGIGLVQCSQLIRQFAETCCIGSKQHGTHSIFLHTVSRVRNNINNHALILGGQLRYRILGNRQLHINLLHLHDLRDKNKENDEQKRHINHWGEIGVDYSRMSTA